MKGTKNKISDQISELCTCKFVFKSLVSNNVSSFRDRERGRRSILFPELEDVNKSRSNQQRNAYNSTYQTRHKQCAANVVSAASIASGSRAVTVATIPPLRRQASVHRLRKRDIGRRPGVSFEERLHIRRGVFNSTRVLVLQAVLRWTQVPSIWGSGKKNDGKRAIDSGECSNPRGNHHFMVCGGVAIDSIRESEESGAMAPLLLYGRAKRNDVGLKE